jgi:hypothetical protein
LERIHVVLSRPSGFQVLSATSADPSRLGTGPILDIAFDRNSTSCTNPLSQYVKVRALKVFDRDGLPKISQPSPSEEAQFDGSQYFHFHYVDPDRPS